MFYFFKATFDNQFFNITIKTNRTINKNHKTFLRKQPPQKHTDFQKNTHRKPYLSPMPPKPSNLRWHYSKPLTKSPWASPRQCWAEKRWPRPRISSCSALSRRCKWQRSKTTLRGISLKWMPRPTKCRVVLL